MNTKSNSVSIGSNSYDLAIQGGRVMDPLTRTDVLANIGIKGGKIAAIVPRKQCLKGKKNIEADGLVVAPGFINIHGEWNGTGVGGQFHVRDGITTEVTGNCGFSGLAKGFLDSFDGSVASLGVYFEELKQKGLVINLASYVGHNILRELVGVPDAFARSSEGQLAQMVDQLHKEMEAGAIGISFGPFYGPGVTYDEMVKLAKIVSGLGGGAASHVRHAFAPLDIVSITEAIDTAREADIPFIISHMGGATFSPKSTGAALELIVEAMEEGLKIATDCHSYDAFNTSLGAAVFDQMPVQKFLDLADASISDLRVGASVIVDGQVCMTAGESFSSLDQWDLVRDKVKSGIIPDPGVIGHIYKSHKTRLWYSFPFTMVENDGAIDVDPSTGKYVGHPRGAGSFARFLGYWVREKGVCDLMTAIGKTSTIAAVWLGMENKGRAQVGADADLTLFDPETVIDQATYLDPGIPSKGIPYVIVNGVVAVSGGELTGNLAGQVIRRTWRIPGKLPSFSLIPGTSTEALGGVDFFKICDAD